MTHNKLTDEELETLISELELCGIYGRQVRALAELQEYRNASACAIAWTDAEELRDLERDGCGAMLALNRPDCQHIDPRRQILLFTASKPLNDDERRELQEHRKASDPKNHFLAGYDVGHSRGLTCGQLYKGDDQVRTHRIAAAATYVEQLDND